MDQLAAQRQRTLAEEEERRKREEQRRIDARRAELQKQEAEAQKKLQQAASAQKQASQQLQRATEQQRQAELLQTQKVNGVKLQGRTPESCAIKQINAIAIGADPNKVLCGTSDSPAGQVVQQKAQTSEDKAWNDQLDSLRRNAVRLQPEDRKITQPPMPPSESPPRTPSITGFQQEITPDSEIGRLLTQEAAAQKLKAEAERKEQAREEDDARSSAERQAAYEQFKKSAQKGLDRLKSGQIWQSTSSTQTETDDSDCKGLNRLSLARQTACAAQGQTGAVACNVCQITKTCSNQLWGKHCDITGTSCQRVCR